MKKYLTFIGPITAGKGTQAEAISKLYGFTHISTGAVFRDNIARGTELGKQVKTLIESGNLVPDDLTNNVLREVLAGIDLSKGFILDGYPRSLPQAEAMDGILAEFGVKLDKAILLDVSAETIMRRVSGRYQCAKCGEVYNKYSKPTKVPGICDVCGGTEFTVRADDSPEFVKIRLAAYENTTKPILDFYEGQGRLARLDAELLEPTTKAIEEIINS